MHKFYLIIEVKADEVKVSYLAKSGKAYHVWPDVPDISTQPKNGILMIVEPQHWQMIKCNSGSKQKMSERPQDCAKLRVPRTI